MCLENGNGEEIKMGFASNEYTRIICDMLYYILQDIEEVFAWTPTPIKYLMCFTMLTVFIRKMGGV